ncbi:MAG: NAD(P)-binding domain-containing protein, partial [Nitrospira sp.]|nr:NAD(P)-binding domain-containing protein [Nitrospira sp.]
MILSQNFEPKNMKSVGVIGVGAMGKPMAKNLLKKGYPLTVYDIREEPLKELQALGARVAKSPKEVGEHAQVVVILVFNYPQVEQVIWGDQGLIESLKEHSTVIVMSTISPGEVKHLAGKLEQRNIHMLDAPVSGGT